MKQNIHPNFYEDTQVICSCGNIFTTGSTKKTINVEVCSKCHPFYTGEQRFIDTKGRVETFQKKQAFASLYQQKAKKSKKQEKEQRQTKSLKELLQEI